MKNISIQSPTRVDLAGGTLDLWPLFNFIEGAATINVAVDIMTSVEIEENKSGGIELVSSDMGVNKKFKNLSECLSDTSPGLRLLQAQLKYWKPLGGFSLRTSSQSPVGGGLGGSSSLTISLMKAFSKFCDRELGTVHELVHSAHNIESEVLHTPTGTQDYYPAASGGINILNYGVDGIDQEILSPEGTPLETHFLLAYTGKAHHSGLNNFEVLKAAIGHDEGTLKALRDLRDIAYEMIQAIKNHRWQRLPPLFRNEFEARVRLAPAFSSPEIRELEQLSLKAGAEAVKICGAGGGGCVLIWVAPAHRERVISECQKAGFKTLAAKPVKPLST